MQQGERRQDAIPASSEIVVELVHAAPLITGEQRSPVSIHPPKFLAGPLLVEEKKGATKELKAAPKGDWYIDSSTGVTIRLDDLLKAWG